MARMVTGNIPRGMSPDGVGCFGLLVMIIVALSCGGMLFWLMWVGLAEFQA